MYMDDFDSALRPDPRQVGDLCYCAYWGVPYLVLAVTRDDAGHMRDITVLNLTEPNERDWYVGTINVKSHMTPWDWRRDQFIDHGLHEGSPFYGTYWDFINELRDRAANWINPKNGRKNAR